MLNKYMLVTLIVLVLSSCNSVNKEEKTKVVSDKNQPQQTIYFGGDIITMDGNIPQYVEAVIERNGKIIYAGKKVGAVNNFTGKTIDVDLKGKTMLPGFIDPHGHFMSAIMMVNQVNVAAPPVGTSTNISQIIEKLEAFKKERKIQDGDWIIGWGYDQDLIEEQRHVTKKDLDIAFPKNKVMIIHVSMHGAVLNSKALEWAEIDKTTETPEGGVIARMSGSKEPAGLIMEMAYIPVFGKLPQPTQTEMLDLMKPAQMKYTSEGYTQAVEGFTHTKDLDFLMMAANKGKNIIDIVSLPGFTEMDKWFDNPKYVFGEYHNKFKIQACKITLDGSPQGRTALMDKPYLTGGPNGEKNWQGESSITQEQLDGITQKLAVANIPLHIHTNGGGAIDMMLKSMEKTGITAKDDRRTVVIHSQFQRPDHLPKYKALGLTPSYFTLHTFFWGDIHVKNMGKETAFFINPMKAAKDAGLVFSNHSDFNVTPLNPFFMMWSAMARESRSGNIIGPNQRVDAYTTLQALTTGPAYQIFEENRKGKIKVGMLADFVIIKNNPLKQDVGDIKNNEVIETIKEGEIVYQK